MAKVYSFEEVSSHNTQNDCWIIVNSKVYDVTSYLEEHPGGDDVLLLATGKDATEDFEDAGHSTDAREIMEKYYVGEIDTSSFPKLTSKPVPGHSPKPSDTATKILHFVIPVAIVGVAVLVCFYIKKR
ncbi:hypothetical protein SUGI_0925290 [Cryptomeria japonica]|uniref:cytochrome b5 n=1 Tax=Cryptomeria japonica TaxID=3369 RepID=UPI0024146B6F|nr:cytochrome b5 [Cryptomeria japonica]GLJ44259.1 hypothetical protein SUGI_0925290 [Cryptomeria japonica]